MVASKDINIIPSTEHIENEEQRVEGHLVSAPQGDSIPERIFEAFESLDTEGLTLIVKRFGLDGSPPQSRNEVAKNVGVSSSTINELEADTLRSLLGYGSNSKKSKKKIVEQ